MDTGIVFKPAFKQRKQPVAGERIIVIEDEQDISRVLEINLLAEGFKVSAYRNGQEGLGAVIKHMPDLVLLDLMLPQVDGLDICRELKANPKTAAIPIIMVTAKGEESDIVLGLGLGADDYVTKPFSIVELLARVKAALRRNRRLQEGGKVSQVHRVKGLELDAAKHTVSTDGAPIEMTATEFRLLHCLLRSPGRVYSRMQLIEFAIGDDVIVNERTIDSHMASVRRKIGAYRDHLKTVWGVGYRFEEVEA